VPVQQQQHMHSDLQALELDLEHYEVPPPTLSLNSGIEYAAKMAENPHELQHAASEPAPFYGESRAVTLVSPKIDLFLSICQHHVYTHDMLISDLETAFDAICSLCIYFIGTLS
jgi:hypothetical protein